MFCGEERQTMMYVFHPNVKDCRCGKARLVESLACLSLYIAAAVLHLRFFPPSFYIYILPTLHSTAQRISVAAAKIKGIYHK